jgi:hypothetical protein
LAGIFLQNTDRFRKTLVKLLFYPYDKHMSADKFTGIDSSSLPDKAKEDDFAKLLAPDQRSAMLEGLKCCADRFPDFADDEEVAQLMRALDVKKN